MSDALFSNFNFTEFVLHQTNKVWWGIWIHKHLYSYPGDLCSGTFGKHETDDKCSDQFGHNVMANLVVTIRQMAVTVTSKFVVTAVPKKLVLLASRRCICVYEISHIRESVRWISKNWQGRVWYGEHFNSDSRLGPGPAFDLIIKYYLVSQILSIL